MSKSQSSLQAVLERQARRAPAAEEPSRSSPGGYYRPSRAGKRLISGHFDPKVAKQLKLLAVEEDTSVQALLEQALNLLFIKKGKEKV
jgi:hypothetical protein